VNETTEASRAIFCEPAFIDGAIHPKLDAISFTQLAIRIVFGNRPLTLIGRAIIKHNLLKLNPGGINVVWRRTLLNRPWGAEPSPNIRRTRIVKNTTDTSLDLSP